MSTTLKEPQLKINEEESKGLVLRYERQDKFIKNPKPVPFDLANNTILCALPAIKEYSEIEKPSGKVIVSLGEQAIQELQLDAVIKPFFVAATGVISNKKKNGEDFIKAGEYALLGNADPSLTFFFMGIRFAIYDISSVLAVFPDGDISNKVTNKV